MIATEAAVLVNAMDPERLERLLTLLVGLDLEITLPPRAGLVMLTVYDSFGVAFHPGEALATEAQVSLHGCEGHGMVLGEDPRRALAKAAVDALYRCGRTEPARTGIAAFLAEEADLQRAKTNQDKALIAATRVNFDLMPGA